MLVSVSLPGRGYPSVWPIVMQVECMTSKLHTGAVSALDDAAQSDTFCFCFVGRSIRVAST